MNYLKAGYPAMWVQTHEEARFVKNLAEKIAEQGYQLYLWDLINGLIDQKSGQARQMPDPLKPLQAALTLPEGAIIVLKDFHKFIGSVEVFRMVKNILPSLKASDKHLLFVSPVVQIPVELEKDVTVLDFALPSEEELVNLAQKIVKENDLSIDLDERSIKASKGLTLDEAENAFALSLVESKKFSKTIIENEKLNAVRKSGLLELYRSVPIEELGGLKPLKRYILNRKRGFEDPSLPTPKGVLLVGLPGAGKSLTAKVVASVLDMPLVRLDISSLKGSLVGESEQKMRQALSLIDSISPCVIWIDEIEKALGGVQSSNRTDGGTTSAMFGYLLTWMQESKSKKYIVATSNDIQDLLAISQGALLRRFDDIFFVDLPSAEERREILAIMNARYKTTIDLALASKMEGWTGAEIEKFVIASLYDGIDEAFANTKPLYEQNREVIELAREWAKFNARIANSESEGDHKKNVRKVAL